MINLPGLSKETAKELFDIMTLRSEFEMGASVIKAWYMLADNTSVQVTLTEKGFEWTYGTKPGFVENIRDLRYLVEKPKAKTA